MNRSIVMVVAWLPRKDFKAALAAWPTPSIRISRTQTATKVIVRLLQTSLPKLADRGRSPMLTLTHIDAYMRWCANAGLNPESLKSAPSMLPSWRARVRSSLGRQAPNAPC